MQKGAGPGQYAKSRATAASASITPARGPLSGNLRPTRHIFLNRLESYPNTMLVFLRSGVGWRRMPAVFDDCRRPEVKSIALRGPPANATKAASPGSRRLHRCPRVLKAPARVVGARG